MVPGATELRIYRYTQTIGRKKYKRRLVMTLEPTEKVTEADLFTRFGPGRYFCVWCGPPQLHNITTRMLAVDKYGRPIATGVYVSRRKANGPIKLEDYRETYVAQLERERKKERAAQPQVPARQTFSAPKVSARKAPK
jgi:hypothetical protein